MHLRLQLRPQKQWRRAASPGVSPTSYFLYVLAQRTMQPALHLSPHLQAATLQQETLAPTDSFLSVCPGTVIEQLGENLLKKQG